MKTIFTGLSPNLEHDDLLLTLALLSRPWEWIHGNSISEFKNDFGKWLGNRDVFTFESGRSALYFFLLTLDLKPTDEVLIQAYTCVAVPDPVIWAGAKPVYVDIDPDTFNMSVKDLTNKINPKSKVIVLQHTFGLPAQVAEVLEISEKHKLL